MVWKFSIAPLKILWPDGCCVRSNCLTVIEWVLYIVEGDLHPEVMTAGITFFDDHYHYFSDTTSTAGHKTSVMMWWPVGHHIWFNASRIQRLPAILIRPSVYLLGAYPRLKCGRHQLINSLLSVIGFYWWFHIHFQTLFILTVTKTR